MPGTGPQQQRERLGASERSGGCFLFAEGETSCHPISSRTGEVSRERAITAMDGSLRLFVRCGLEHTHTHTEEKGGRGNGSSCSGSPTDAPGGKDSRRGSSELRR